VSDARFRELALALPEAEEKAHFGKADFRVRNKIFAGFTADGFGHVKLKPEQQEMMCAAEPKLISAIRGGWGQQGWTRIDHRNADDALVRSMLLTAWKNVAPKSLQR
jgi:hypothetical protein